ncbi:hypothetical protein PNA2_0392 [Pyrococcus sp. NA2]|nr:hypothetical protein PNA2_0392 [Pyrococcus sp. NA2]
MVYYQSMGGLSYLLFSILCFLLAFGVRNEVKIAIKIALIYSGLEFLLALLLLIAGNILSGVDAAISLLIAYDILGYIQKKYGQS